MSCPPCARPVETGQPHRSLRTYVTAGVLGIAALTFFSWRLEVPRHLFYDEVLYVDAAKAFLAGTPDTNPEIPPFGKYLIAGGIRLFGDNAYGWRAASVGFGAAIIVGVFLWLYLLLDDYELALMGAMLALLDNFVYVMSRVAMMDVFLAGFVVLGLVAFTAVLKIDDLTILRRRAVLGLAGAMLGFALACKWNAIDTLAMMTFATALLWWSSKHWQNSDLLRYANRLKVVGGPACAVCLIFIPVSVYALAFWPMSHNAHCPFSLREVVGMNVTIWKLHRADQGNVAIASSWYSWIFQVAPQRALSYLVGNWVIMWSGVLALLFCLRRIWNLPEALVVSLYAANLLQWAITPQKHLYYYYYFPCAIFLGAAIPVALHRLPPRVFGVRLSIICVAASGVAFLFCMQRMAGLDSPFDCAFGCWP